MNRKSHLRAIAISIFVIGMSFWNFSRLPGSECLRAIHIVSLLTCGAGLGVLLTNLFMLARNK